MQDDVGALRSEAKLVAALDTIRRLTDEFGDNPPGDGKRFDMRRLDWFDLRNMLLAGRVVAEAALARSETRGAQQREDYPRPSPDWAFSQIARLQGARIELSGGPRAVAVAAS
jgi:succinate dehydrogenase/fumarate reductase flavoprotein subunit